MSFVLQLPRLQLNNYPKADDISLIRRDYQSEGPGTSRDSFTFGNSYSESTTSESSEGSSSSNPPCGEPQSLETSRKSEDKTPTRNTPQDAYLKKLEEVKIKKEKRIQDVLENVYRKKEQEARRKQQELNETDGIFRELMELKGDMHLEEDANTISSAGAIGISEDKTVPILPLKRPYLDRLTRTPVKRKSTNGRANLRKQLKLNHSTVVGDVITFETEAVMEPGISTETVTEGSINAEMPDGKAPHFPQQPVARQNDDGSLELECFVDANPTPQVKWYYDNKEVENSGRFSANLANKGSDSYSAILTIKELADADAGAYRCAIVNPHGKGNANFNLKLTGFSSPTFVEKPQISSRDDGQVMVMEFRAKSILEPTFVWQKLVGGGAEEIIANSDRIKAVKKVEAGSVYYSALEIKEPTKDKDAGQFICTVKNESGKLTATFTVKFEVPEGAPSFTRKPQILQQTSAGGEPAICFDIGYSARMNPQVTWISPKSKKMKESSRIKFKTNDEGNGNFTAQLELTNYKAKDSGTYTCNIKNDAGEANVELTLNIEGPLDDYADDSEN